MIKNKEKYRCTAIPMPLPCNMDTMWPWKCKPGSCPFFKEIELKEQENETNIST